MPGPGRTDARCPGLGGRPSRRRRRLRRGGGEGERAPRSHPETSPVGIALTAFTTVFEPTLGVAKRRLGRELTSGTVAGGGTQNLLCAAQTAAVLAGLVTNPLFGLWWLDPAVALVIAAIAVRRGRRTWRGEESTCASSRAGAGSRGAPEFPSERTITPNAGSGSGMGSPSALQPEHLRDRDEAPS
jgi:hypothetical protein